VTRWTVALAAAAWMAAALPALADVVSDKPDAVVVTIYSGEHPEQGAFNDPERLAQLRASGLALITETRTVDLPQGRSRIQFRGVGDTMVPQTAELSGLPGGVIERDFNYDLLSPGSLLAKSVGARVRLVRTDPKTGKETEEPAILRSGPQGVVLDFGDRYEGLHCSGLPERLVFDKTPDGLISTATLSATTYASHAGRYVVKLSYLASGLGWSANYVAQAAADGRTVDLTGWITLANYSGTSFVDARAEAIAGRLYRIDEDEGPVDPNLISLNRGCWPVGFVPGPRRYPHKEFTLMGVIPVEREYRGANEVSEVVVTGSRIDPRAIGDYQLYPLPETTTVAAKQAKQVQFLDEHGVRFQKFYRASIRVWNGSVDSDNSDLVPKVMGRINNTTAGGLGRPMPQGMITVLEPGPAQSPIFTGEAHIYDSPVGLPVEFQLGNAMDIEVRPRFIAERTDPGDGGMRLDDIEAVVRNGKSVPVTLELFHEQDEEDGIKVVSEPMPHAMKFDAPYWTLHLKPGETRVFRYTVRYKKQPR
jgi:hypothetical protein